MAESQLPASVALWVYDGERNIMFTRGVINLWTIIKRTPTIASRRNYNKHLFPSDINVMHFLINVPQIINNINISSNDINSTPTQNVRGKHCINSTF